MSGSTLFISDLNNTISQHVISRQHTRHVSYSETYPQAALHLYDTRHLLIFEDPVLTLMDCMTRIQSVSVPFRSLLQGILAHSLFLVDPQQSHLDLIPRLSIPA